MAFPCHETRSSDITKVNAANAILIQSEQLNTEGEKTNRAAGEKKIQEAQEIEVPRISFIVCNVEDI